MDPIKPIPHRDLYHICDLAAVDFKTTADLEPLSASIGQNRAMEAIRFGVGMDHEGFNLYLMGSTGLGKHALIASTLEERRRSTPAPDDWCYVANFDAPHRPATLRLPPGRGRHLRSDLRQLVEDLLNAVPAAFQSEEYNRRAEVIQQEFKEREDEAAGVIGREAKEQGIALIHTSNGYTLAPIKDGHMLSSEEFAKLREAEKERISALIDKLRESLQKTLHKVPLWQKEMRGRFKALNREITETTVNTLIAEQEANYADVPGCDSK